MQEIDPDTKRTDTFDYLDRPPLRQKLPQLHRLHLRRRRQPQFDDLAVVAVAIRCH